MFHNPIGAFRRKADYKDEIKEKALSLLPWSGRSVVIDIYFLKYLQDSIGRLENILEFSLSEYQYLFLLLKEKEYLFFLKIEGGYSELRAREFIRDFIYKIQQTVLEEDGIEAVAAIGDFIHKDGDIKLAVDRVIKLGKHRVFYSNSAILDIENGIIPKKNEEEWKKLILGIKESMQLDEYELVKIQIKDLLLQYLAGENDMECLQKSIHKLHYYFSGKGMEMNLPEFDELLEKIRETYREVNISITCGYFMELANLLSEYYCKQYSNKIRSLLNYIQLHYTENIGLNELSNIVNTSPVYLSQLFKKEVGVTYSTYITRLRIDKAIKLLKQGDYKIYEISEMVGYQTIQYFSKVFKKETGKNPSDYQ